jgi:uncharacterized membrane protein YqiK
MRPSTKPKLIKLTADADKAAALARAEGERALNEALNMLSAAQIDLKVRTKLLEQLPAILAEAVKPMEKIDSIRMFHVTGTAASNMGQGCNGGRPSHRCEPVCPTKWSTPRSTIKLPSR